MKEGKIHPKHQPLCFAGITEEEKGIRAYIGEEKYAGEEKHTGEEKGLGFLGKEEKGKGGLEEEMWEKKVGVFLRLL